MNQWLLIPLRLIHILSGVFWVGALLFAGWFLMPTVREAGEEGGRFMQRLIRARRLPAVMGIAGGLTMLSGLALYGWFTWVTKGTWAGSWPGIAFGVGGASAIIGSIVGGAVVGKAAEQMSKLGATMGGPGGPPSGAANEMKRLQGRMESGTRVVQVLVIIAASAMAIARYL